MEGIITGFDIRHVLKRLAEQRPIFHSEADFQFALARQIETLMPGCGIRLERPFSFDGANRYLDLWLRTPGIAIELKYRTSCLSFPHKGESFSLKSQNAHDLGRYDFIADIRRIERIAAERRMADGDRFSQGYAVLLTNDHLYWKPGRKRTFDKAFRIHKGRTLTGTMAWAKGASEGTTKTREQALSLSGSYELRWEDYFEHSVVNGEFRYLAVRIP